MARPWQFEFRLPAGKRIGFLRRSVSGKYSISDLKSEIPNPPIRSLAPLYQRLGDQIEDTAPPAPMDFGAILISRPACEPAANNLANSSYNCPIACGTIRTSPTTDMKLVSPDHLGTMCW